MKEIGIIIWSVPSTYIRARFFSGPVVQICHTSIVCHKYVSGRQNGKG